MSHRPEDIGPQRLTFVDPRLWAVLGLAAVFLCLGALIILSPAMGIAIFGMPAPGGVADGYLRAIGFRDVALAFYLGGLACFSTRRSVAIVLGASVVIPIFDVILVWSSGTAALWQIALHIFSGVVLTVATVWVSTSSMPSEAAHH